MRRLSAYLLIFVLVFFASFSVVHASQTEDLLGIGDRVLNRFFDMLSDSAKTYLDITDGAVEVNVFLPDVLLVNMNNPVDRYYRPENMIDIASHVSTTRSPLLLEENAANAYIQMIAAMRDYGITDLAAVSGFRDFEHQTRIHNIEVERQSRYFPRDEARRRAAMIVAAPGTSEHQTGLAVDVSSAQVGFSLSTRFENTAAFSWLSLNAHEYGFIIRYPRDKTDITGVIFEPWHLRYVGADHAARIFESGLTLEEYFEEYLTGAWSE